MTTLTLPRLHIVGPLGQVQQVDAYARIVANAAEAGSCAIHVRLPGVPGGEVLEAVECVRASLGSQTNAMIIVNDRADVTQLSGADGLHLGERSIPVDSARSLLASRALIGRSVHDVEGAVAAQAAGADYLFAGHVYATESKQGELGRGLNWLSSICRVVQIPVIAIGGVRADRVSEVLACGAWGVAVAREVLESDDPRRASSALLAQLECK